MFALLLCYCAFGPLFARWLVHRFSWARTLGTVVLCCGLGILVANGLPADEVMHDARIRAATLVSSATLPLAIPLLLFQADLSDVRRQGRPALTAFFVSCASVFVGTLLVLPLFAEAIGPEAGMAAGMVMSVYIGGTPNLAAVQAALGASEDTFGMVFAATTFLSSFYLMFLLTVAKPLLVRFYPAAPPAVSHGGQQDKVLPKGWAWLWPGVQSVLASAVCLGLAAGLTFAVTGSAGSLGVVLGITTLGIAGSSVPRLRALPTNQPVGDYLIWVFCVASGTMMDIGRLVTDGTVFLTFTAVSVLVFLALHLLICRLLRLDLDNTLIMSVATMFGPPFIPPVAQALGNRAVLVPGMTLGFAGYAVGTYLGIAVGSWW